MGYKVLALKWRPQKFEQVIGQEHITQALSNAIKFNRISHAFTFSGPRGVGKTTTARILAQELNQIEDINSSFDIIEMDAASNRGIDEIRSLRQNVSVSPAHGKYKIYIIDEVHMLTKEAFNALLKTLEEPPEYTIFILATTDPHKMPATILSRTQRYDFRRLRINDIKKQLIIILNSEEKVFDDIGLELIARKADGSMRDALGYLDQIMNYCEDNIDLKSIQKTLGVVGNDSYLKIFNYIYNGNTDKVVKYVNQIVMDGVSVYDFVTGLNSFLRELLYVMLGNSNDEVISKWLSDNIEVHELDIIHIMELIFEFELKIKSLNQSDLALELLMVKLCNLNKFLNISDVINSLDDIDDNISFEKKSDSKPISKDNENNTVLDKKTDEVNVSNIDNNIIDKKDTNLSNDNILEEGNDSEASSENKTINLLTIQKVVGSIDDVINYIDEKNSKVSALLSDIEVLDVSDLEISIKVNNMSDFIYDTLMNSIETVKNAFNIILNTEHDIIIKKGSLIKKNNLGHKGSNNKDEEHPLFMDVLEKFDGEILR
tara:strand:+ start:245 stop:1879 length:1635 start_codon:yes stop_codon:yes gene_type:complete